MKAKKVKEFADKFKSDMKKDMTWDNVDYHLGSKNPKPFKHLDDDGNESWRIILRYGPKSAPRKVSGIAFG